METKYQILLFITPVLMAVLGFIGAIGVKALMQMSKDIHEIKTTLASESAKREAMEKRIERIEDHIFA